MDGVWTLIFTHLLAFYTGVDLVLYIAYKKGVFKPFWKFLEI